jgi:hypothetical protein
MIFSESKIKKENHVFNEISIFMQRSLSSLAETGRERQIDFNDKLIHACVANHYNSNGISRLPTTLRSNGSYLKILEV